MQSAPQPAQPEPGAPPESAGQGYPDNDPSALTAFRDTLDPYGAWVDDPTYGLVWVPNSNAVGPDFEPYVSAGHWTYDTGWTWVSDYPWGWAPFHYGRWVPTPGEGWAWVPGRRYSGAWVDWRVGNGYVGWAPARPDWAWQNGTAVNLGVQITPPYYFAPQATLFEPTLSRHIVRGATWMSRTAPYAQVAPEAYRGRRYGPPPATLGIPSDRVTRPPERDVGLTRAVQYARPATTPRTNSAPPQPQRTAPVQPRAVPNNVQRPTPPPPMHPGVTAPQPAPPPTMAPAPHATTPPPARPPSMATPPPAARPTVAPRPPSPAPHGPAPAPPTHPAPTTKPQH